MTRLASTLAMLIAGYFVLTAGVNAQTTSPQSEPSTKKTRPAKERSRAPAMKGNEYTTEAEAKQRCGTDTVVWVNPRSKVYHMAGAKDYGKTRRGAYMCKAEAESARYRAVGAGRKAKS